MPQEKETTEKTSKKLGFSLSDITNSIDDELELEKKLKNSIDYSKSLLWLSYKFLEEKKGYVTNKELSQFLKKIPQNTIQIMNIFVIHNLLNNYKRGKFKAIIYHLKNPVLLRQLIPTAKKTIGIEDKTQKKLK